MKVKVYKKSKSNCNLQIIEKLLLLNKIKLEEIPALLRIKNKNFYICSFRNARSLMDIKRYIEILEVLENDIIRTQQNTFQKEVLVKLLDDYIQLNPFRGEKEFEYYKKNFYEKVLPKLRNNKKYP
ncbi:MAG: hypothetical protein ACI4RM_07790 [Ruminococcus sp.]